MFCGMYLTQEKPENNPDMYFAISCGSCVSGMVGTFRTKVLLPSVDCEDGSFFMEMPSPWSVGLPFFPLMPFRIRKNWNRRVTSCSMVWLKRVLQSSHSSRHTNPLLPRDSEIAWAFCLNYTSGIERPQKRQTRFSLSLIPILRRSSPLKVRTS